VAMAARARHTQKRDCDLEVRIQEEIELAGPHPPSRDPTPSAVAIGAEQHERLVVEQPDAVRAVAELRMEGRTFDEIAAQLAMDESTARRKMRELREECE
jgi:DNA-directed RNA polymerase specialized sigma24 family protein